MDEMHSNDSRPFFLPAGAPIRPEDATEFFPGHVINPTYPSVVTQEDLRFGAMAMMKQAILSDDPEARRQALVLSDLYADRASFF